MLNGYDGFGGVHDNLAWNSEEGWIVYSLNNKVIFETTKSRSQKVLIDSTVQISTLALNKEKNLLAAGEGSENKRGNSLIYIYSIT